MSNKLKAVVLGSSALVVLFAILGGLGVRAAGGEGAYRQLGVYSEVLSRIRSDYVEERDLNQVT
ncbi:MAG: peptidase S41, partial [Acidobacteria bacterium]|nr:peptidase S41 [Acidobacteriota bacterium]